MPRTNYPQATIEQLVADLEAWRQRVWIEAHKELMPRVIECATINMQGETWGEHAAAERSVANSNTPFKKLLEYRDLLTAVYHEFRN